MGQKRHALHGSHGDVQGPRDVHGHGGGDGHGVGDVHRRRGGDVDRGDVDRPRDGERVLQAHRRGDVHRVGGDVHLRRNGDGVAEVAAVHRRGDGGRDGDGRGGGRVADVVAVFVAGVVEVGLAVRLQVAGDVGGAEHLATDVAGDLPFVPDHVRTQSVFGGEGGSAGRYLAFERSL